MTKVQRELVAELRHQAAYHRLHPPRRGAGRIGDVGHPRGHRSRKIENAVIGTLLNGRFRLEEQIGSGGMSTVYRAFDEVLERSVAIKVMHASIADDGVQLERFRREARTAAKMSHPHVVTVIDAGEDEGHPFIVLEYVEGETLKDRIRRCGPLPVPEAVAYAIEIGRALQAAHAERLVHRDVKPQNVLLDPEGRAKVTDFGISRSLDAGGPDRHRPRARDDRLRVARAGARRGRDRAVRRLLARDRACSRCSPGGCRSRPSRRSAWR